MKKSSITLAIISLLSTTLSAQFNLQLGASPVVSKTTGLGGEATANLELPHNLSIGLGTRPIKFEEHRNLYVPVYASVKYYYSLPKAKLFASIDPGYGIYATENVSDTYFSFQRKGAIYLSGGIGIMGKSRLSPYASIHFTKFGFREQYNGFSQYRPISTFAFTAGLAINKSTRNPVMNKPEPTQLPVSHTQEYYLQKSKHQKTTGWILLGSGVTLITTGVIIAANQDGDGVEAAIPLVFISGPGIVSSLVSIPFFISSAHNKKKAANLSPAVFLQQYPVNRSVGSIHKRVPALGLRLDF